jgi:hypothetical protein
MVVVTALQPVSILLWHHVHQGGPEQCATIPALFRMANSSSATWCLVDSR